MNKFDREYWNGSRETALAVYNYVEQLAKSPAPTFTDVRTFTKQLLEVTADVNNKEFRESLGLSEAFSKLAQAAPSRRG